MYRHTILIIGVLISFLGCSKGVFYSKNSKCSQLSQELTMIEHGYMEGRDNTPRFNELKNNVEFCQKQMNLSALDYEKFQYLEEKIADLEQRFNILSEKAVIILTKPIG